MLVCGEKAPNRADRMPRPRAATWPDPSRSASLPVGKRTSPSSANVLRSDCVTVTFARTAMSPTPVADPSTKRDVESTGLVDVPPKKCWAVVPPNGMIWALLVPRSEADTIGSTTPMSTLSSSPKLTKNDVTVMSRSSARRSAITSFSWVGTPYGVQLEPTRLSQAGPVTFWCVNVISIPFRLTPRSAAKCMRFTFAPTKTRPRPRVWARSANTGPAETEVRTGTPPSNRKVEPPLVALTGRLATLPLMALLMNEMSVPFSERAAGMKWSACNAVAEAEPAVPPRNSGALPAEKMNSSEILSRSPCACTEAAASVSPTRHDQQRPIHPPRSGRPTNRSRRDAANGYASSDPPLTPGSPRLTSSLEMSRPDRTIILDARALSRALQRMAVEVLELAHGTDRLVLIGIQRRGVELAERIARPIQQDEGVGVARGALDITLYRDDLETVGPKPVIGETRIPGDLAGKHVVIVDDVLYTGRTVRAALDELADFGRPKRLSLCVPVDRGGRELPIQPDIVGTKVEVNDGERVDVLVEELDGRDEVDLVRKP